MKRVTFVLMVLLGALAARGQVVDSTDENLNLLYSSRSGFFDADSVWLGATFMRDTSKPFVVWYKSSNDYSGDLFLMVPGAATNGGDSALFLFNSTTIGARVDLTNHPLVSQYIHNMDTVYFRFISQNSKVWYTGANRAPGDGFLRTDRYWSGEITNGSRTSPDGSSFVVGRRWAAAGWIRDIVRNTRTDTVEFGFESRMGAGAASRWNWDDIVFKVTGIFLIKPASVSYIDLQAFPSTQTIQAGDSVRYKATVYVDTVIDGVPQTIPDPNRSARVTWTLLGDTTGAKLIYGSGPLDSNVFTATKAYKTYTVRATVIEPLTGQVVSKELTVTVIPDDPYRLVVESAPDTASGLNLNIANPVNVISIPTSRTSDSVYAIIRDRFGNYIVNCGTTRWTVISGTTIVSAVGGRAVLGEGVITKLGPDGIAQVEAYDLNRAANPLFRDTFTVVIDPIVYTQMRFVVGTGGQKRVITSLEIQLTKDTVIYAEVRRQDGLYGENNDGWVKVPVDWYLSSNLFSATPPPRPDTMWRFAPITDTGTGTITIRMGDLSAVLAVVVKTGGPHRIVIYGQPGAPSLSNEPYFGPNPPTSYTYFWPAGREMSLVGKVFDPYNIWLSGYETDPLLSASIRWQARFTSSGLAIDTTVGRFSSTTGAIVSFLPTRAYTTIDLIATFDKAPLLFRDTVRITILPGAIERLVIEPTPDSSVSLWAPNPIDQIVMQNNATNVSVYGMLRDRYGNFVKHADSASWSSRDSSVVLAAMGPNWQLGQGLISRVTNANDTAQVLAQYRGLVDSVMVIVTAVTYDSLQIYVLSGGIRYIDSLVIRTDQDTTLYARGKRSDNGQWENVAVRWQSPGVTLNPDTLNNAQSFRFRPVAPGTGLIVASRSGTSGLIADTVRVTVLAGLAASINIYPKAGAPAPTDPTNTPLPDQSVTDTIIAGRPLTLAGKLFDLNGTWLPGYESAPLNTYLTWRVVELPGNNMVPTGTLTPTSGHLVTFTATRAYNRIDIFVDYNEPGRPQLSDVVRFYVKPDTAARLYIESSPSPAGIALNQPDELNTITFSSTDTIRYAYAVLRDRFGNFTGPSTATNWLSRDTSVVGAREGNATNGEGLIFRIGRQGQTTIVATNRLKPFLMDSATVILQNIYYTQLRIVVGDSTGIDSLVMRTDQDTTLYVQGKRSDNGRWESVPANWTITPVIPTAPSAPGAAASWTFSASDTGSARITVTMGNATPDTVYARFLRGLPASVVIYPQAGPPSSVNAPYVPPTDTVRVTAGATLPLVAKVFDAMGYWLHEYERTTAPISWRIIEVVGMAPTGTLSAQNGALSGFWADRARNIVLAVATFDEGGVRRLDSVRVYVRPGAAHHLVIEPDQNWQASPYDDNPIDTVFITSRENYRQVYAVLRDSLGNFVSYSTATVWNTADSTIVVASQATATIGEGGVQRVASEGATVVTATSLSHYIITVDSLGEPDTTRLRDDVVAKVLPYYYTQLRILDRLTMQEVTYDTVMTDDSASYIVQGLRSDDTTGTRWEVVAARWQTSSLLPVSPAAPERAETWTYSPTAPAEGWIRVTMDNDGETRPDTVWVVFVRSPPSRVELDIITPPEQRIAGDTIYAIVRIYNSDGLVPGTYCDNLAVYQDIVGSSPSGVAPNVTVDDSTYLLNLRPDQNVFTQQCFTGGIDTVKYVLTRASTNPDSVHHLYVKINNVWGEAPPFQLHPGALEVLVIENSNGTSVGERIEMPYGSSRVFFARGYDRFGNLRGDELSDWSVTGTLHAISRGLNVSRIFYETSMVTQDESGWLRAVAVDTSNGRRWDSVYVVIAGPPIRYLGALTQDVDGDGYLDGVVIRFDREVTIPSDPMELAELYEMINVVDGRQVFFVVDSVWTGNGTLSDTVLYVRFKEDSTTVPGVPQTAWVPYVFFEPTFLGGDFANLPTDASHPAALDLVLDGAGPVVWQVTKYIEDGKPDVIEVIFSEPVRDSSGGALSLNIPPSAILNVWRWDGATGTFVLDTVMLAGLTELIKVSGDTVMFVMTNGADLIPGYFFNVVVPSVVADATELLTSPPENNRLTPLVIKGEVELVLQSFPNPGRSDTRYQGAMEFDAGYASGARQYVLSGGGGTVTSFVVVVSDSGADGRLARIQVRRQIYDVAGNMVHSAVETDLLRTIIDALGAVTSSKIVVDLYWNGFNAKGMPVAPGVYREVVYVYHVDSKKEQRAYINLGIRR